MALVYCKACGKEISPNAKSCPSCGEPQKTNSNAFLKLIVIIVLAISGFIAYSVFTNNAMKALPNEVEQKKALINQIMGKDCNFLSQASSEYIKSGLLADIVSAVAMNRCECIQEVIVPKMIEQYSIDELNDLQKQPIHALQEVGKLISENANEIKQHCLTINL